MVYVDGKFDYAANKEAAETFITEYILPYIRYCKVTDGTILADKDSGTAQTKRVYLNNGTTFEVKNGGCLDIYFDANGDNNPNENGKDIFTFTFCNDPEFQLSYFGNTNQYFGPLAYTDGPNSIESYNTRDKALAQCKESPSTCSVLLQRYDNFEFKEDYPW